MKKEDITQLQISDYTYHLPDEKIAKYPLSQRDTSRLLVYRNGKIEDTFFNELENQIPEDSLLIFNNTRVIHARLLFTKDTGATIEVFCLSPFHPADYAQNFEQRQTCAWTCMIGNAKRWRDGELILSIPTTMGELTLKAVKEQTLEGEYVVRFSWDNDRYTFSEVLEMAGKLPIPPYLNRASEANDDQTYQTVYSRIEGSVAAPTAGLHFTDEVLSRLRSKNVQLAEVTLHVGAGTFRPVKSETIGEHEMHTEFISVSRETIQMLLHTEKTVVVVGTTSMRTVESLYHIGRKLYENPRISPEDIFVKQWDAYEPDNGVSPQMALQAILNYLDAHHSERLISATQIMIAPGYTFRFAKGLITNFHQPQSTLLLLISAFVGEDWQTIYRHALSHDYRFLSYGDSSLLWRG